MKTIKLGSSTVAYVADDANTLYTMAANKAIASGTYGLDILGQIKNRDFEIDGSIKAGAIAVRIGLDGASAAQVDFTLGEDGHILSGSHGIASYGAGHVIRNEGTISAGSDGIRAYGAQTIINTGSIVGYNGIDLFSAAEATPLVKNFGSITGGEWSIYGSGANDKVVNQGNLTGDVMMAGGDDTFVFKGGTIDGVVRGDVGDDVYVARAANLNIVEDLDEGTDTVRASVDFELQSNVEKLYLIGKADIDGAGTGGDNELYGNAGKNHLSAGFGFDVLNGGAGNDVLEGGVGADDFYFQKGTGRDVVADYEATFDDIHFYALNGASDFADMIENHAEEKNGNVVITFGKDVIVLKDHAIVDLKEADFHFYG